MRLVSTVFFLVLFLSACVSNPTLKEYSADNQTGVLAIPVAFEVKGGPNQRSLSYFEIKIVNLDTKLLSDPISIFFHPGVKVNYLNELTPGKYRFTEMRVSRVQTDTVRGPNSDGEYKPVNGGTFEVKTNQITVFPHVFGATQNSVGHDGWNTNYAIPNLDEVPQIVERLELIIDEDNTNDQWIVNWPGTVGS